MGTIQRDFYLLLDASITCSHLATEWISAFKHTPHFRGILIPTAKLSDEILQQRDAFHKKFSSVKEITQEVIDECHKIYTDMSKTDEAMVRAYGVSELAATSFDKLFFIGPKANSPETRAWFESQRGDGPPAVFVCATCILKPWWIEDTDGQVFNTHTAVLPHARGMYAIENVAAQRDVGLFERAAGFTIHYIDAGVDTGAIIKSQRVRNPFGFDSIWALKGHVYKWEGTQYVSFAREYLCDLDMKPAGIITDPKLMGENFRMGDFTDNRQQEAESGYEWMKAQRK